MTFPNGVIASYKYNADGIRTQKTVGSRTTDFFLEGSTIVAQKTGNDVIWYYFDGDGTRDAIEYGGKVYYYMYNPQGDVIGLFDDYLNVVVEYTYDSWGKIIDVDDTSGVGLATANPFRYRGYYYDEESGLYYLNSRYYHPEIGRFINADGLVTTGSDLSGTNLFAYCGNNPVNRTDSTGQAWWHWALGAAVVAGCAVATVVTCGGFAAAASAVCMVGSGVAAATTASTIAAGAFIGSASVYGMAVLSAACTSSTIQEFNAQGNWGTVAITTGGALFGGYYGYGMSKTQATTNYSTNINSSRGSTGRTIPNNLNEQLAMKQVKSNPHAGTQLTHINLNDPRWPSSEGWVKMQQIVSTSQGDINIHYVYNQSLNIFDDFKFKP